jgi:Vitamin K-dependent gamma-carboxylase
MRRYAAERLRAWVAQETASRSTRAFRIVFAAIWLVYDTLDLTGSATAQLADWTATRAPAGLVGTQAALVVCEMALVLLGDRWVLPVGGLAVILRAIEWSSFRLNDFAYYMVTMAVVAHTRGPGLLPTRGRTPGAAEGRAARWPRDVLVWQAGWMYLASGLLKLNPSWLSGGHLLVRFRYLAALGWPYPTFIRQCTDSLRCDHVLAVAGATAELCLGAVLFLRPSRRIALPLAIAIHGFGALMTNVWFFGASLVAQVGLLAEVETERSAAEGTG